MASSDIVVRIASSLAKALGSSSTVFSDFSTEAWGIQLPPNVLQAPGVEGALQQAACSAERLGEASTALDTVIQADNRAQIIQTIFEIGLELKSYFTSINNLVESIEDAIDGGTIPDDSARQLAGAFIASFSKRLVDNILISAIEDYTPQVMLVLKILGLAEWQYTEAEETNELFRGYVIKRLHLERIKDLISDPITHFQSTTGWGTSAFNPKESFQILREFFDEEAAISIGEISGDPYLQYGDLRLRRISSVNPPGLQFEFETNFGQTETVRYKLNDQWGINLLAKFGLIGSITLKLLPPLKLKLLPPGGEVSGEVKAFINRNEEEKPFNLIGSSDLMQLAVDDISIGVGLNASWDVVNGVAVIDPLFFSEVKGATLKLKTSDADSFLGQLLSNADIKGSFDFGLEWLASSGLRIKASGGIEIALPIHQQLGIIEIDTIYLALKILNDGTLLFETSSGFKGLLGPLLVTVDRIGAQLGLSLSDSTNSKYGFFNLDFGFKPPSGVGLAIDATAVKGGGFLSFDVDNERYTGALELVVSGFLTLKAIGLITTKMPDGSKGFSLLVIITAEFGSTGYQLGYGFTLLGVGGLLGLNRTTCLEPLKEGVRTGAVNRIMFPTNVVQNATRIISDLRTFFPAEEGNFLIGPMAKLGWGTPTLISLSLGIIIEIPSDFVAILGVLKVILPDEKAALLKLQVNFIGVIEFDKKRAYLIAALFESRVLFMTIEGEMGVLVAWGKDANFVVSVGGFHPEFDPPPLPFSEPKRIAISILNTSVAKIRVEGYFAVTSNTVQFGARAELYFGVSAFNIDGHLAFDALFRFSPFYFIIQISASLSVKVFGVGLFSVRMRGSLEGPTPWHVEGTGSISLLFFDIDVDFSHTWGEEADTILPPIQVIPLLKAEFEKLENWQAQVPAANNILVSLRKIESTEGLVVHPVGSLKVSQRVVPLELTIDKVGAQKPSDANKFTITVDNSSGLHKEDEAEEMFAMAQFKDMSDSEKLNAPAYEKKISGVVLSVGGEQLKTACAIKRVVRYEEIIIDSNFKRFVKPFFKFFGVLFNLFLNGNAITKSTLSNKYKKQRMPFADKITIVPNLYVVATNIDNIPFSEEAKAFTSYTEAEEYMNEQVQEDPNLQDSLHVIPRVEMQGVL
jgi:hypothetical protein